MSKYRVITTDKNCIEISAPIKTILAYRIPYKLIKNRSYDKEILNRFIVYILVGKNNYGKDMIYVGKSKNGLKNRPGCHEDKYKDWTDCYILTDIKERTILNDGTIQYIENQINERINEIDSFNNQTNQTIRDTANRSDMEDCDIFLENAYEMLNILGLDLSLSDLEEEKEVLEEVIDNKYFHDFPDHLIKLKDEVESILFEIEPNFSIIPTLHYYRYCIKEKTICTMSALKDRVKLYFNIPINEMNDPNNLLRDVSNVGKLGIGDYLMIFSDNSNIDDIRDFLEQTVNYND